MKKDFDGWNENKKHLHVEGENKLYHKQEIWWCSLGINVGFEQDGTGTDGQRPVLILKSMGPYICLVIPLTTSPKKHPMRVPLGKIDGKQASALFSQIRVIDTKRLINKVCFLESEPFARVRKTAKDLLF